MTGTPVNPGPKELDRQLYRLFSESNSEFVALLSGAQAPDIDLRATIAGLRSVEPLAPAAWRPDIAVQYRTLRQLADAHGDRARVILVRYDEFAAAGSRLMSDCGTIATARATSRSGMLQPAVISFRTGNGMPR